MKLHSSIPLTVVGLLLATGCGSKPEQQQIKPPIIIGDLSGTYGDFDSSSEVEAAELIGNISDPLMAFEPGTTSLVPHMASTDPTISADGLSYTFHIREGVTFADGSPVDAYAFKYAIDRVAKQEGTFAYLVSDYVDHIETPDALTITFVLHKPSAFFLSLVVSSLYTAVNPSYPEDKVVSPYVPTEDLATWQAGHLDQATLDISKFFGYGQYRIDAVTFDKAKGDYSQIDLVANPNYWGTAAASERVTVKLFDDTDSLYAAFIQHEIDVIPNGLSLNQAQTTALKTDTASFQMFEYPGKMRVLDLNTASAPFNDKNTRQAIAAAIDREAIITAAYAGNARPAYSMLPEGLWGHADAFKTKYGTRNLPLAKTLLENAGYTTASKLVFELWYNDMSVEEGLPEALKTACEETGLIEVILKGSPGVGPADASQGLYASRLAYWSPDYVDPDDYLTPLGHSGLSDNFGVFYNDAALDSLLDAAVSTTDFSRRKALYEEAQDLWAEGVPVVPLVQLTEYVPAQNGISLIAPSVAGMLDFGTISRK